MTLHLPLPHQPPHGLPQAPLHEAPLEEGGGVQEAGDGEPLLGAEDEALGRRAESLCSSDIPSLQLGTEMADLSGKEKPLEGGSSNVLLSLH